MMERTPDFKILDCTVRDGGYVNRWRFDMKLVHEIYRALSKSGVDYVEIGYRGTTAHFDKDAYGPWRFSNEDDISEAISNISGARVSVMADCGHIDAADFSDARFSAVDMVRVAAHRDRLAEAAKLLEAVKAKGYEVALNAMGYTNYSKTEKDFLTDILKGSGIDFVYVADSYGAVFPDDVKGLLSPLLDIGGVKVGFHPHNSLQMAFANTLEAIRCGAHIIDSTVYGMGRAAGNLPTEIMVTFLENQGRDKVNSIPVLNLIDKYFLDLHEEHRWGYQLPYMLSGMFQCHPDYAKSLIEYKEYTMEDIWKAMEYVRRKNPAGFSRDLLKEIVNKGIIGMTRLAGEDMVTAGAPLARKPIAGASDRPGREVVCHEVRRTVIGSVAGLRGGVPYEDRYRNRDFLILANGSTLKSHGEKISRFIEKYDPVILGANFLGGLFTPNYHAFNSRRRFTSYVETVSQDSKLMVGGSITDDTLREYTDREFERLHYIDILDAPFGIVDGVITSNCRTISILLLGVAIVMGAERVFAAGMDGYADADAPAFHFYKERDEKEDPLLIVERHRWCQRFLREIDAYLGSMGREGVHILTPTSYKSFYKGIDNYIEER